MDNEVLLVFPGYLMGDKVFQIDNTQRSNETRKPFIALKEHLSGKGYELKTADLSEDFTKARAVIFFDMPAEDNPYYLKCQENMMNERTFLVVGEPPAVVMADHDPSRHDAFSKVLTFNDALIDGEKYFRLNYTIPKKAEEKVSIPRKGFGSKRLLCLISSNKFSSYEKELYGERINAVRFMEKYHPADFDLYGVGWDSPMIHNRLASRLKVNGALWRFWPKRLTFTFFPSYKKGETNKKTILPNYKFTISYENCITEGYISEKILEAMLYGCVPVYLGDPNIERKIPADCFVDKREYPTYESLYKRMSEMDDEEHEGYLDRMERFLNSDKAYPFTIDAFIESFEKILGIGK